MQYPPHGRAFTAGISSAGELSNESVVLRRPLPRAPPGRPELIRLSGSPPIERDRDGRSPSLANEAGKGSGFGSEARAHAGGRGGLANRWLVQPRHGKQGAYHASTTLPGRMEVGPMPSGVGALAHRQGSQREGRSRRVHHHHPHHHRPGAARAVSGQAGCLASFGTWLGTRCPFSACCCGARRIPTPLRVQILGRQVGHARRV
jgi:hypothetical protein